MASLSGEPSPPRKRHKYPYPRYTETYRCATCGIRLSKTPLDFEPMRSHILYFKTRAYCPFCDRDMGSYQKVYQGMMFADPDADEAAKAEDASSPWRADKDPSVDLGYAPPPFAPPAKILSVLQLEHMRRNKLDQRWELPARIRRAARKEKAAAEKPPKARPKKDHVNIRHRYPRLVTTYLCDTCGFKADDDTSDGYLLWCLHDGTTRQGTTAGVGIKLNGEDKLQGREAALMRWVGVSYQPAALYPEPKPAPYRVESQMFGLQGVLRRVAVTTPSDHERELDAWVAKNWDAWQANIASWTRERAELLRAPDDGEPRRQRPSIVQDDAELAAVQERSTVWAERNARRLGGLHPPPSIPPFEVPKPKKPPREKPPKGPKERWRDRVRRRLRQENAPRPAIGSGFLGIRWAAGKPKEVVRAAERKQAARRIGLTLEPVIKLRALLVALQSAPTPA